jgi:hypothetical protein
MADSVATNVLFAGTRRRVVQLLNVSDGTGESDVVKVDVSALTGPDGSAPTSVAIEAVEYNVQGFTSVRLEFDATTDDKALLLGTGSGTLDFTFAGGIQDPASSGTTGDLLLTTAGAVSGATYDITLFLRLKD